MAKRIGCIVICNTRNGVGENADGTEANPAPCRMCRRKIVNAGIKAVIGLRNGEAVQLDLTE